MKNNEKSKLSFYLLFLVLYRDKLRPLTVAEAAKKKAVLFDDETKKNRDNFQANADAIQTDEVSLFHNYFFS